MKYLWKMSKNSLFTTLVLLGLLAGSCTQVYFEKPVPQNGAEVTSIPADWAGVYISEPSDGDDLSQAEQLFPQFFRLEHLDENRLMVSVENRIRETDLPRLREELGEQIRNGTLVNYTLSEGMILCTLSREDGSTKQEYSALVKSGSWYILAQTMAPFQLYDLKSGVLTNFNLHKQTHNTDSWLPNADSISIETQELDARKDRRGWYFNTWDAKAGHWLLLYVEETGKGRLMIKQSQLEAPESFKNRREYFDAITPFRETETGNYVVNPDDEALARLLAEPGLFQTTYLRRIEE